MKVLFLKLVPNVGHVGEIKEVNDSYARNFLIPKGLARKIDPNEEKRIILEERKKEEARRNLAQNRQKIYETLNLKELVFKKNITSSGKIFGSIGEREIIDRIFKDFSIKLEKKHIKMPNGHIKKVGKSDIFIELSKDLIAKMTITVE